ncbi:MAG TPA: 30S ribosomal protein S4 [bacterium]|nr:30S ribosomal protein S4 [bacterium]
MARNIGPKCRLCRREGTKLYLKGSRCESEKCALNRKAQAPGQHGTSRRSLSEYGKQMREKQKAKRIYGILEKQFKKYVNDSLRSKGVTGDSLIQKLEGRLDNLVFRSGFAMSRSQSRQYIRRGLFMINGKVIKIPSQQLKIGDIIKPVSFEKIALKEGFVLPEYLEANIKEKCVRLAKMPTSQDYQEKVDIQSIIEFYSR